MYINHLFFVDHDTFFIDFWFGIFGLFTLLSSRLSSNNRRVFFCLVQANTEGTADDFSCFFRGTVPGKCVKK